MDPITITLLLLVVAVILFATEKIPVDIVGLLLVIGLVMTGVLTIKQGVAGFGDDIIITIGGLFVLTGGLVKTGLVDLIGRRLYRIAGNNELLLTILIMLIAAVSASVLKNTTTTAMYLPVVLGLADRAKIASSKLLMPLAFGAILGGSCTLIGTSTNLAVSGAITRYGMQPYSMFELTAVGAATALIGTLYMIFVGRHWLPNFSPEESLTEQYHIREYLTELVVLQNSQFIGKTLGEANINRELELSVLGIIRGKEKLPANPDERIFFNDLLIVEGRMTDILRVKSEVGLDIKPDLILNDADLEGAGLELFEVMVLRGTELVGQNLKALNFRQRYDLTVLAINRHGKTIIDTLSTTPLEFGDVLLVQGKRKLIEPLVVDGEILLLEEVSSKSMRTEKRPFAIAAFLLFITLSLSKLVIGYDIPLAICVLSGVLLLLATKTIRYNELYSLIDFRLLVLIACMMSFGTAMEATKADQFLAKIITDNLAQYGELAILGGFFLLTIALTQPMSNQAAALVVLPVAVQTAILLGLNPRTFAVAITYAASCSFMTPLEPACVLVYTPGRYRFMDFVKIGTVLTIIVFLVVMFLVPMVWKIKL